MMLLGWVLPACGSSSPEASGPKDVATQTEVRTVDGKPTVFINGIQNSNLLMTDVYHYRDNINPDELPYGDDWVAGVKAIIDDAVDLGAGVVRLRLWWNEIDRAVARPVPVTASLDFSPVDQVMDYAAAQGILVMLSPEIHKMIPRWWADEHDFPTMRLDRFTSLCIPKDKDAVVSCVPMELCDQGQPCCTGATSSLFCCAPVTETLPESTCSPFSVVAKRHAGGMVACAPANDEPYKTCDFCSTDAFGWKYPFASMGSAVLRADYGEYLKTVIARYKLHPALFGWIFTLGATGEDQYGDYSEVITFGQTPNEQFSDYSPFMAREFSAWLTTKYQTTSALRAAWGDLSADLGQAVIPPARKFFKNGQLILLAECGNADGNDSLTQIGKDFCNFRQVMRKADRDYYIPLFTEGDPTHIYVYNNSFDDVILKNGRVGAAIGNPNLQGGQSGASFDVRSYRQEIERARMTGKVMFYGAEDGCGEQSENANQLAAIERFGKAVKCFGGYFGYVSEIRQKTNGSGLTMPSWTSTGAVQAILNIANYTPDSGCEAAFR
jgi:hypothetical protein